MRSASDAVAYSRRFTTYRSQYCLNFVQTMLAAPWSGPSAQWAWDHAQNRHGPDPAPPAGVPVWILGSRYGHIALSVGGGRIRSTDWPRAGVAGQTAPVGECGIDELARRWGRRYAGWAESLGGQRIPGIGAAGPAPVHPAATAGGYVSGQVYVHMLHVGVVDSDSVRNVQRRLIGLGYGIPAGPTGRYGAQTVAAVAAWQRAKNQPAPYNTGQSLGPRQTALLMAGTGLRVLP